MSSAGVYHALGTVGEVCALSYGLPVAQDRRRCVVHNELPYIAPTTTCSRRTGCSANMVADDVRHQIWKIVYRGSSCFFMKSTPPGDLHAHTHRKGGRGGPKLENSRAGEEGTTAQ